MSRSSSGTRVDRPVFIIGTGRSGTTLAMSLLGYHPSFAWFSSFQERFHLPQLGWLSRVHSVPVLRSLLSGRSRYVPRPIEAYWMFDECTNGLFTQHRNLTNEDATPAICASFRESAARQQRMHGKPRFIAKYTGVPRIQFIRQVFPDARFIHVLRDGRAVANSLIRVPWWAGDESTWRYGAIPERVLQEFEASGRESVVLAACVWRELMQSIYAEASTLPENQILHVRYEELVRDPIGELKRITEFCEIPWEASFESHVRSVPISNMDRKWRTQLTPEQSELVRQTLGDTLGKYGFS